MTACSNKQDEITIFSIPGDATPSQLDENGFTIHRRSHFFDELDSRHAGEVEYGELDLAYARVYVSYLDGDTTRVKQYHIYIDCKPFEKMTGFKAKDYSSLEIDGFKYKVELYGDNDKMPLHLKRLGL